MKLVMEAPVKIANGRSATIVHDEEGRAHLFYEADKLMWAHTEVPLGIWDDNVRFINAIPIAPDDDVSNLHVHYLPKGKMWFTWKNGDTHRFAVHTDDGPQHELTSPYRLYYAVDTEKLYMNISETWQFIGSPNIANLVGYSELVARIEALEAGGGTSFNLDLTTTYNILVLGRELSNSDRANTENILTARGHTLDNALYEDLPEIDVSGYDLLLVSHFDEDSAADERLIELYNSGTNILLGYQFESTTFLLTKLRISGASNNNNVYSSYYVIQDHVTLPGINEGEIVELFTPTDWSIAATAPYVGTGLLLENSSGFRVSSLIVDPGTKNLDGETMPYAIGFSGLLHGRGTFTQQGKDHVDRLVRYVIQRNARLGG